MAFLQNIGSFDKSALKPTTTVVRQTPVTEPRDDEQERGRGTGRGLGKDEDITSYYDGPEEVRSNAKKLAQLIKDCNHLVVYTGAGISTSTGLPDYRSEDGVWTMLDKGLSPKKLDIEKVTPSYSHMALCALNKAGKLGCVVSTNIDGLHMRSGLPKDKLAELHGNAYTEKCEKCNVVYLRTFDCTASGSKASHKTDRQCEKCSSQLYDSIINFGEDLPEDEFNNALKHSETGDLALVLGTSMRVQPASKLPASIYKKPGGKMVIVNLQKTPFDEHSHIRIQANVDDVMGLVMQELGITVDLETPSGIKAHGWVDNIDAFYGEKQKQMTELKKKKLEEFKSQVAQVKSHADRTVHAIENVKDKTEVLSTGAKLLIFFKNCTNCNFTVPFVTTKIIIEGCDSCTFDVKGTVITNYLEVINSKNITVNVNTPIYTTTADKSNNIKFSFSKKKFLQMVIVSQCELVKIDAKGVQSELVSKPIETTTTTSNTTDSTANTSIVPSKPTNDMSFESQYITRWIDGKLLTELVLRECEGFVTTEREKKLNDAAAARTAARMEQYYQNAFKISDKKQ